jgi:hypothetical protein
MFCECENFTKDLGGRDVSQVIIMNGMLRHAKSFVGGDLSNSNNSLGKLRRGRLLQPLHPRIVQHEQATRESVWTFRTHWILAVAPPTDCTAKGIAPGAGSTRKTKASKFTPVPSSAKKEGPLPSARHRRML